MAANDRIAMVKGIENTMFLKKLSEVDSARDYIIIIDRSASMKLKGRWKEAEEACKVLCHCACKCDADGITLYFFSSHSVTAKSETPAFIKYENVATGEDVIKQFESKDNEPHGGTDLVTVLKDAFASPDGKPLSILVITDGMPDEPAEVSELIKQTANDMATPDDVYVTIIQVGDDHKADEYLNELDEGLEKLGCKHDIVDVISHQMMLDQLKASEGKFSKLIESSVIKAEEAARATMTPAPPTTSAPDTSEDEAKLKAEKEAAEAEATAAAVAAAQKAQQETDEAEKLKVEQEAADATRIKAEQDAAQAQAAEAARLKAELEEAARKAAEEEAARIKVEQEAEAARLKAEEDARIAAEEEARQRAEQEATESAQRRDALQEQMDGLSDAQINFQNEWDATISTRSANEIKCEEERKTTASSDLKQLGEQNKIKLASKKDANRTAEQVYLENIESDADNDNEWERILKLINASQESASGDDIKSDVVRMKSLFIQLKSDPPLPRVSAK